MELHTKYVPGGSESVFDIDHRVGQKTHLIPLLPEDRFLCSLTHIFAGLCYRLFYYFILPYCMMCNYKVEGTTSLQKVWNHHVSCLVKITTIIITKTIIIRRNFLPFIIFAITNVLFLLNIRWLCSWILQLPGIFWSLLYT